MTGHMIGTGGAVEAIVSCLAIRDGIAPPTINCLRPLDPEMNFVAVRASTTTSTMTKYRSLAR